MKRILLAALAATALSATAFAQASGAPTAGSTPSEGSSTTSVGTSTLSTGQVGSSNLGTGAGTLTPVSPNTTDMDQPAGTSLSGGMTSSTGLDTRGSLSGSVTSSPSSISPGQLTPPSGMGLPEVGTPQPSTSDSTAANTGLSPTVTPDVNR